MLNQFNNGDLVYCRYGRDCIADGRDFVNWNDWQYRKIYAQEHKGQTTILTTAVGDWAEYGLQDAELNGQILRLNVEDYTMEIDLSFPIKND